MSVRAERRVDKALFYTMWASLIATVAVGIWLIVKTLGLNPEFETFLAILIPLLIFMLTLALKVGRIQGELKTLRSKTNTAHSINHFEKGSRGGN